jgi:hypothetical protein
MGPSGGFRPAISMVKAGRSAEAKESHSLRQDATVLAGDLASACSVSCEYDPRDSRPGIHFRGFCCEDSMAK